MPILHALPLKSFGIALFRAAGVPESEAETVADALVEADLAGHDSHGVLRIPSYIGAIRRGSLVPGARPTVSRETSATAKLDGNRGFGQVAMRAGMVLALQKSGQCPLAMVTVTRCGHTGRLGGYAGLAPPRGRVGIVLLGGRRGSVAPFGGIDGRMYVNTLSIAVPGSDPPLILDMSVSATGFGKLMVQRARNEPCPEGWLLDADGRPTRDPFTDLGAGRGAILPLGGASGHKGSGLAMMIGLLAGLADSGEDPASGEVGHLLMAIDIEAFLPLGRFQAQVREFVRHVRSSRPAEGLEEVLIPGDRAARNRERRLREGIPIEPSTWEELTRLARELGVPPPGRT
jgi:uncharacterized oxidoreductase